MTTFEMKVSVVWNGQTMEGYSSYVVHLRNAAAAPNM